MARSSPFPLAALAVSLGLAACSDKSPPLTGPPGALINVRLDSQVGVLLDELPPSLRARVAGQLAAAPEAFWLGRARAQARLAAFRLSQRPRLYPSQGKGQLALPPEETWIFSLRPDRDGVPGPQRLPLEGHDVVVVNYSLTGTLVAPLSAPARAEPALDPIGGTWTEPFTFPLDPEQLVQRTGSACLDESLLPAGSVDPEEAHRLYNHDQAALPGARSCRDALSAAVGTINTSLLFQRVPWDPATADRVRTGPLLVATHADLRAGLVPDAAPRVAYRYFASDSCAVRRGCVGAAGWRRVLAFTSSLWNVGGQDLPLGAVDYLNANPSAKAVLAQHHVYELDDCAGRYYFPHLGAATFGPAQANLSAQCLRSATRASNNEFSPLATDYSDCGAQGIAAGWAAVNQAGLACQWVDVTGVPTTGGVQDTLHEELNQDGFLCEGTPAVDAGGAPVFEPTSFQSATGAAQERQRCSFAAGHATNNQRDTAVTVGPPGEGYVTRACARPAYGPLRDCGFTRRVDLSRCAPGSRVSLRCTVAAGGAPQAVRLCESSAALGSGTACAQRDALASAAVDAGGVSVSFTCPAARDASEPGGGYSVYAGPLVAGDGEASVSCQ